MVHKTMEHRFRKFYEASKIPYGAERYSSKDLALLYSRRDEKVRKVVVSRKKGMPSSVMFRGRRRNVPKTLVEFILVKK